MSDTVRAAPAERFVRSPRMLALSGVVLALPLLGFVLLMRRPELGRALGAPPLALLARARHRRR